MSKLIHFDSFFINELLSKINPSEIIKKTVSLKQKSSGEYLGLCPFHQEKTPSFTVSDNKGFYHCFGCGENGNIINFLQKTEGINFPEALKKLSILTGTPLPEVTESEDIKKHNQERSILHNIMNLSCEFFRNNLKKNKHNEAGNYLLERGISEEAIDTFKIGFAENSYDSLCNFLEQNHIPRAKTIDLGLAKLSQENKIYDYFRNRIMFPICDHKGNVIAFGGRSLDGSMPKYLNSPETQLFKKGEILYNEHIACSYTGKDRKLIVVEGYTDVVSMHCASLKSAVSPLGTALTLKQLKRLWNRDKTPVICMDGDAAGRKSMNRTAACALPMLTPEYNLKFAILPEGSDPDSIIKNKGAELLEKILNESIPMSQFLWEEEFSKYESKYNKNSPEISAALEKYFKDLVFSIENPLIKEHYEKFFKAKIWENFHRYNKKKAPKSSTKKSHSNSHMIKATEVKAKETKERDMSLDRSSIEGSNETLISIILNHPDILQSDEVYEDFINLSFTSPDFEKIQKEILDIYEILGTKIDKNLIISQKPSLEKLIKKYKVSFSPNENDPGTNLKYWKYYKLINNKAVMEKERESHNMKMNEASEKKAFALSKEIVKIDRCISDMQMSFNEN